jgi:Mg2+ and Co2+ transporter CorA
MRTILAISTHYDQLATLRGSTEISEFRIQLELYREQLDMHKQSVVVVEKFAERTMRLLLELLGHRRDEKLRQTGDIIQSDGKKMHHIAQSSRSDLEETRSILQSSATQTERMKRLGLIATIYLPATLVAVGVSEVATFPEDGRD